MEQASVALESTIVAVFPSRQWDFKRKPLFGILNLVGFAGSNLCQAVLQWRSREYRGRPGQQLDVGFWNLALEKGEGPDFSVRTQYLHNFCKYISAGQWFFEVTNVHRAAAKLSWLSCTKTVTTECQASPRHKATQESCKTAQVLK